jgi:ABC-type transport system substrate-binding protein
VVCLAACRGSSPPSPQILTLRIGVQNSPEALPVLSDLLFADPLLTIDWHGRPSFRLASDYQWQDEGRGLQISIRKGVEFHDGTPVTAAAVAEILRQRTEKRTLGYQYVTGVESPRDGIVLIHLSRPDAFLIDALAGSNIVDAAKPDVGTGPFKLLKREPVILAARNVGYYRGTPGIEQVQVTPYDSPRQAWSAMMRSEVDMVPDVNRDSVEFLEGAARFGTYPSFRPFYIPLVFNVRHPILKNLEVRRAIAEAIDRDEIVRRALRGHGQVADDPLWLFNWAYTPAPRRHGFNPGAAGARLDAAGFPVRRQPGAMPSRFQIRCLFWDKYERIALMLQRQLAGIDVDLVLERADDATLQEHLRTGSFDTYLYLLASGKSFDWMYRFWHSAPRGTVPTQDSGYTAADEALDRLRQVRTDSDVRMALTDLRAHFYDDVPAAFITWLKATRAVDSRFDVGDASDPEMIANLWRWSVAKPAQRASR